MPPHPDDDRAAPARRVEPRPQRATTRVRTLSLAKPRVKRSACRRSQLFHPPRLPTCSRKDVFAKVESCGLAPPHSSGGSLPQTEACMAQLRVGDLVIRSHRLLKTRGAIVRVAAQRRGEAPHVWVKWNHSDTLPTRVSKSRTISNWSSVRMSRPR